MTNFSTPNPGDLIAVTDLTQVFDPINDLESGAAHWAGTTSGSANAYTASLTNTPGSLTAGLSVNLRIHASNTGASTLNLNGLGDVAIRSHNAALTGGELLINATYNLVYDGTYFQVVGSGSGGPVAIGDISDWPAGVSVTELGYLDNASDNIQTQINGKADTSHTHVIGDLPQLEGCAVNKSLDQTLTALTYNLVTFTEEGMDLGACHDNSTNSERFTAPSAGVYLLSASLTIQGPATPGYLFCAIFKNGGQTGMPCYQYNLAASEKRILSFSWMLQLAQGDYVDLRAYPEQSNVSVKATALGGDDESSTCVFVKLGRA